MVGIFLLKLKKGKSMNMEISWHEKLKEQFNQPYFLDLMQFLEMEKMMGHKVFPPQDLIYNAFLHTPFDKVKVVIVGQDPYHGEGQAHGLSFSVLDGEKIPPSLKNIYKELISDVHIKMPHSGNLTKWADQGVLLLNATLTVRQKEPGSHHDKGWERFTDEVLRKLVQREDPIVFMLWGNKAKEKLENVFSNKPCHHLILTAAHPSPFSARLFLGCKHFSKANSQLISWGKAPIDWQVD